MTIHDWKLLLPKWFGASSATFSNSTEIRTYSSSRQPCLSLPALLQPSVGLNDFDVWVISDGIKLPSQAKVALACGTTVTTTRNTIMHIFRPIFDSHVQEIWKPSNFWPRAAEEGLYFFLSNGYTTHTAASFFLFLDSRRKILCGRKTQYKWFFHRQK